MEYMERSKLGRYSDGLDDLDSIPGSARFLSSPQRADRLRGPPNLLDNGYRRLLPRGVKRQGREADHSHQSSAKVKKDGDIPVILHMSS
jgi:hypothetical protein